MSKKIAVPAHEGRSAKSWLRDLVLAPVLGPDDDESKFTAAKRAFAAMGKDALPWLAEEFTKETLTERRTTKLSQAVHAIGPEAEPLIPVLLAVIEKYPDSHVTHALAGIGDAAIPALIQTLRHPNQLVRVRACDSLASAVQSYGLARQPFLELIPEILGLLHHEWHMLRWRAAMLLGALCLAPDQCIPELMRCLQDPFPQVQGAAAQALGMYGDRASIALPRLFELAKAKDVPLREFVISSLGHFSDPRIFPMLIEALRDPDVSTAAIYSLVRGSWSPDVLVPVLCDCVQHGNYVIRWAATNNLGKLGEKAVAAVPVLRAALAGAEPPLAELMMKALDRIECR